MLIYHQMPSLSASLDKIQKISKLNSIYLFLFIYLFIHLYLFIYFLKKKKKKKKKKPLWH